MMSLDSVWHQVAAQRRLQLALRSRRMPHAYRFTGPEGVGKELLARAFAQILLCPKTVTKPVDHDAGEREVFGDLESRLEACGVCTDCNLVSSGSHPDLHVVHRELTRYHPDPKVRKLKSLELSVEVIRCFLIEQAGTQPVRGRARVFIVREAELLSDAAQNAVLKTLEEPPPDTYIVLLAVSAERLLPTTRSRTQPIPFGALPTRFVRERLRQALPELSEPQAHFLAAVSEGRLGPALEAARTGLKDSKQPVLVSTAELIPGGAIAWARQMDDAAGEIAAHASEMRTDASETDLKRSALVQLLGAVSYAFDDALRMLTGTAAPGEYPVHADQPELAGRLAGRLDAAAACRAIQRIAAAQANLDRNVHAGLTLEGLAAELAAGMK